MNEVPKEQQLNAVVLNLDYNGEKKEVALYGKGGSNIGIKNIIELDGKKIELQWGAKEFILPFAILLNDFKLDRYPGSNSPSAYSSDVKIYDKETSNSFEYTIFMKEATQ